MIVVSAQRLTMAADRSIALIRPDRPELRAALEKLDIDIIEALNAGAGMGATLAEGVRASADAVGWVVALADMPRVSPDTLRRVTGALRLGASIAAPIHGRRRGHPVGFGEQWFAELAALDGDAGARRLIEAHRRSVTCIDVDDPGCLFDVDTPGDAKRLTERGIAS